MTHSKDEANRVWEVFLDGGCLIEEDNGDDPTEEWEEEDSIEIDDGLQRQKVGRQWSIEQGSPPHLEYRPMEFPSETLQLAQNNE